MAGAAPDPSKVKGNAPTITTTLCIVLAIVILIGVCIARKTNTLAAVREVATRTRSTLRGRGLDSSTINSIPIVQYTSTNRRNRRSSHEFERGRLDTIPEGGVAGRDSNEATPRPSVPHRVCDKLKEWKALIPKRPTPRLQKSQPERLSRQEETSCAICAEDFFDGTDLRKLPCGHLFHPRCIDEWLAEFNVTCPLWQVVPLRFVS
ncbi:hypothetical protein PFICI_07032 [Pestalotiopsis fici W106-1]|uniref:RING-type domain-containing protein n=1 Tax=Pestalotiopsis fici (strain W106-1 / CGMCC3.15140) TaxID=1229662 RepID=W3X7J6_PESFW|nr:uncharacterized protein PFICI_07032 [Pestalotiopsis fici W106-1]ETS82030.1 hypothetical protein PFICI_07032 [Pestalotiopsis fici W106-1]